ncbi:MOSC domain-containing protein [Halorubrum sp. GN11_10-6_MGM]|uniref:MOSC domain-containing protein n=1 Tax=Halorubrum sp. GN11_10-6_MGM TaxID=2518112 RepID=UPI0010F520EF|nr:MOSC domain-containing protein [Halorubrum sp. GN11_10-6_MGM]TKX75522.1 MOSC domain-containing protein [Halorubrum sp. GN11_10-6_MGM]
MPADDPPEPSEEAAGPGAVDALVTAPESGAPPVRRDAVAIRPDGVEGDRYRSGDGHFQLDGCAVTLVAAEALDAVREETGIDVREGRHRRNVVVDGFGAGMDALLGATVAVGDALLRPTRRRPPCARVEELAGEGGLASALRNRGGLCCDVVEPGRVAVGDPVRIREADPRTAGAAIAERLAERERTPDRE